MEPNIITFLRVLSVSLGHCLRMQFRRRIFLILGVINSNPRILKAQKHHCYIILKRLINGEICLKHRFGELNFTFFATKILFLHKRYKRQKHPHADNRKKVEEFFGC